LLFNLIFHVKILFQVYSLDKISLN